MEQWSIKKRLGFLTLLLTLEMLVLGLANAEINRRLSAGLSGTLVNDMPTARLLGLIDMVHDGIRGSALDAMLAAATHDAARAKAAQADFRDQSASVLKYFEDLKAKKNSSELMQRLETSSADFQRYLAAGEQLIGNTHQSAAVSDQHWKTFEEQFSSLEKSLGDLGDYYEKESETRLKPLLQFAQRSSLLSLVALIAAILTGVGFALYINSSITGILRRITTQLQTGAEKLTVVVAQLSSASKNLSSSSSSQASALQQTAASVQQISAMVRKSAESAETSQAASSNSKQRAVEGQQVVSEMMGAIGRINANNESIGREIDESNKRITEIVAVIRAIGEKTKVINDIVFQTKLLSFNASVEAARAGEHGKGFAVVAEEVGNLAAVSGTAAKEISELLDDSVRKVIAIVDESKGKISALTSHAKSTVDHGVKVAGQCGDVLRDIVQDAGSVSTMVANIAAATKEQATGIDEISRALQLLNRSTQTTVTASTDCARTSEDLAGQSVSLRDSSEKLQRAVDGTVKVSRFVWKDSYALKVPEMDSEHKVLIEKINSLAEAMEESQGRPSNKVKTAFAALATYTKTHFANEEAFMDSFSYSEEARHKEIHRALLAEVEKFGNELQAGRLAASALMNFLNDWLLKHILNVDMRYADEYRQNDQTQKRAA